jgi:hypothetical protein
MPPFVRSCDGMAREFGTIKVWPWDIFLRLSELALNAGWAQSPVWSDIDTASPSTLKVRLTELSSLQYHWWDQ